MIRVCFLNSDFFLELGRIRTFCACECLAGLYCATAIEGDGHESGGVEGGEQVGDEAGIGEVGLDGLDLESCVGALGDGESSNGEEKERLEHCC